MNAPEILTGSAQCVMPGEVIVGNDHDVAAMILDGLLREALLAIVTELLARPDSETVGFDHFHITLSLAGELLEDES